MDPIDHYLARRDDLIRWAFAAGDHRSLEAAVARLETDPAMRPHFQPDEPPPLTPMEQMLVSARAKVDVERRAGSRNPASEALSAAR